jgi:hypothetical protein
MATIGSDHLSAHFVLHAGLFESEVLIKKSAAKFQKHILEHADENGH